MLKIWLICAVLHLSTDASPPNGVSNSSSPSNLIPCQNGWFLYGDKCYKIAGKKVTGRLTWPKASEHCIAQKGTLATIQSKDLNDFLVTFLLLDAKTSAWIGLHDIEQEFVFAWKDGSAVNYTNWEPEEPTGLRDDEEDCIEMVFKPVKTDAKTGQWNDNACRKEKAYICQSEKSSNMNNSPDPRFCPGAERGWKYQDSCYYIVNQKKAWKNAEKYCQDKFQGHLVTIPDFTVDLFLDHILLNFSRKVWIGIKMQEQLQQRWASGWFVAYENFKESQEDFVENTCVIRKPDKTWSSVSCSELHPFVCETSSVQPPVLKQPAKRAECPELPKDWRDFGGEFCYFFDTESKIDWYKANYECLRRGGSLVSIHSTEESEVLHPFIKYTQERIFIGLYKLSYRNGEFAWTDGTHMDFTRWSDGEPSRSDEICGEAWSEFMTWNDVSCDDKKGFICSVKKVVPNTTAIKNVVDCPKAVSLNALIGVCVCIVLVVVLLGVVIYCFRPCGDEQRKKSTLVHFPPSQLSAERLRYRTTEIVLKDEE